MSNIAHPMYTEIKDNYSYLEDLLQSEIDDNTRRMRKYTFNFGDDTTEDETYISEAVIGLWHGIDGRFDKPLKFFLSGEPLPNDLQDCGYDTTGTTLTAERDGDRIRIDVYIHYNSTGIEKESEKQILIDQLKSLLHLKSHLIHPREVCSECGTDCNLTTTDYTLFCDVCIRSYELYKSYVSDGMTSHAARIKAGLADPDY